jgi:hypothetical protein
MPTKPGRFEEKEYEKALYDQLALGDLQWPPGPVLEQYLGFDLGVFLTRDHLWRLHGLSHPPIGLSVYDDLWPILARRPMPRDRLPSFRLNCFIQAKRPDSKRRLPRRLAAFGLTSPYFVFHTDPEQQQCLELAAAGLAGRALFVYAAPVFATSNELFSHQTLGDVVETSTFPLVRGLTGHTAWYYSQPGTVGVLNPEFSRGEFPTLADEIEALRRTQSAGERQSQSVNLRALSESLRTVVAESKDVRETGRAANFAGEWRRIESFGQRSEAPPALVSYLQVQAFLRYFNLSWLVINDAS